jgi:septal ring factor EnvC (AmiA/AmiB activator)
MDGLTLRTVAPMQATQPAWNDQRMDEFAERNEENFREVHTEIRDARNETRDSRNELRTEIREVRNELRSEIRDVQAELKTEIKVLRTEMNGRFAGIEKRFDVLFGALATGFVAAVVQHFLG